jgi:peptidoglycan/LPS O-acetylase OafA/YrhL
MNGPIIQNQQGAARQTSTLATISMIFGVLSFVCFITVTLFYDATEDFFIIETAVIAVIAGLIALFRIRKDRNLPGKQTAIIGLACGGAIILYVFSFVIVVLIKAALG